MKRGIIIVVLLAVAIALFSNAYAENRKINCTFSFPEEKAQIGKPFTFSYSISGGSGNYTGICVEAEFVTVHGYMGNDVDDQYIELGSVSSGTVTVDPVAGTEVILWLRGYDAVTQEYFNFECHEGWVQVDPNPNVAITMNYVQNEAVVGQSISLNYSIETNSGLNELRACWRVGEDNSGSESCEEQLLNQSSGLLSFTPSHGDFVYAVVWGKTTEGTPFYAESEHLPINYSGISKINCDFAFPDEDPQIGKSYSFTYSLSGGSSEYSDIYVEAEFVTVHDYYGKDVDVQEIELGSASSGTVSFTPKAGSAIILWLRGKDAVTNKQFSFECHVGWLNVVPNPNYPVSFLFSKEKYAVGETVSIQYQVSNLQNDMIDGKIWWLLGTDFEIQDHLQTNIISESSGSAFMTPLYGSYIYAVLEGKDEKGNPIYAESEHLYFVNDEEINNIFILPKSLKSLGSKAFSGTAVEKVVMPSGLTITNIAFDAFDNTPLRVIVGDGEDARTYALEHGVRFEPIDE